MVSDIRSKRKTLTQSLLEMGDRLVTSEITNDLKAVTTRLSLHNSAAAQQRALEQGGVLYHLATTARDTEATAASQAAQTAATATGNAARTASTEAATASSHAASAEAGSKTIMQDAAKAFSGVYASVSQIPYVGWILAPIAAATAYGAVAAYEGLASLDVGAWNLPVDTTANLHAGEMVIPRDFASGLRATGSLDGGGDTFGDTHITNHFHRTMPSTDEILAHMDKATRNGHPAARKMRGR